MTISMQEHIDYHNAIDRREAQERAWQAERELNKQEAEKKATLMEQIHDELKVASQILQDSMDLQALWEAEDAADERERGDLYTMGMGG